MHPFCDRIRFIELPAGGKPLALNAGVRAARGDILVFADARQRFAADAAHRARQQFRGPAVGGVTGELILDCEVDAKSAAASQVGEGVGLYWKYEKWLRRNESRVWSTLGATGAIYALRRSLWRPLPQATLLDDVLAPMRAVLAGFRIVFDERAIAFDRASADAASEARRKTRTLAGNYQILALEPRLLLPIVNPVWLQYLSHKVGRLLVPWALIALLATSVPLASQRWLVYIAALAAAGGVLRSGGGRRADALAGTACPRRAHVRDDELLRCCRTRGAGTRTRGLAMTERLTFNTKGLASERRPAKVAESSEGPIEETAAAPPERRDWAFLFMIAFTALVFFRPQDPIPGLELLHLAELCAIGGLAALVSGRLARNQPVTHMTPELAGVVALGGLILATAPFSIWFGGAIGMFKDLYVKIILIFLLMVNVLTSPRRIERLTWLLVLASGYIAFRAVLDYARGINLANGRVEGAVGGMFKNPNDLALNMVAFLPFAVFIALRPGSMMRRATAGLCAVMMLGAIVASHSRSGTLGLVAMLGVLGSLS